MIDPFIGKTIGKYEIVEYIGRGATADVYKAYQPVLERYVAIKLLHPFLSEDPEFLIRFQTEAKAAARLRHPNIVQVIDFDTLHGMYYLVMEFIDGTTLKSKLQELNANQQRLELDEAIRIIRAVATGLAYAHMHGLIHRDIKPANIMLGRNHEVILTDFGTAKIVGGAQHTASGVTVGTAAYASPEQVLSQPTDARSDIYSLGVVLFEMLAGQPPFQADTGVALFLKHITDPVPNPRLLNPALPHDIETLIYKAMAKKLEQRYQSADALIADLDRIGTPEAITPPSAAESARPEIDRIVASIALANAPEPTPRLTPRTAPIGQFQLPPYTMSSTITLNHPAELPAACEKDWARAATHFARGYIAQWLRDGVKQLRADHQHGLADDLEAIANRADSIAHKIVTDDEHTRNIALEEFLLTLGAPLPVIEVAPARLDLLAAGVGETGRAQALTITNRGKGFLFGTATSLIAWLKIDPGQFGCFAGDAATLSVEPNLAHAHAGRLEATEAILIQSVAGNHRLAANIDVLAPALGIEAHSIDLGLIGQGEIITATLTLYNRGAGFLTGAVRAVSAWLDVSLDQFSIPSGEAIPVTLTLDSQSLAAGSLNEQQALVIESNGGNASIAIQATVALPRLQIEPPRVDLGEIDITHGQVEQSTTIEISNPGRGVLLGILRPEQTWLAIDPTAFHIPSGAKTTARFAVANLKTGEYVQAVRVDSNSAQVIVPVRLRVIFSLEPAMVLVPAGKFLRGSKPRLSNEIEDDVTRLLWLEPRRRNDDIPAAEQPQSEILQSEYRIGKYPVTNAEYAVFVRTTNRRAPEHWVDNAPPPGLENHPVVNVTWHQARMYCVWLSEVTGKAYQLPTEAMWEKAARGTDGKIYPWGNTFDRYRCNTREGGTRATTEVGTYSAAGDSPYGCADMAGNVWEWTLDWYSKEYYARSSVTENPLGPANGAVKVIRGGAFSTDATQARAANRLYANGSNASPEIGFRVAIKE